MVYWQGADFDCIDGLTIFEFQMALLKFVFNSVDNGAGFVMLKSLDSDPKLSICVYVWRLVFS